MDREIKWKAPPAQGIGVGARVSAEPESYFWPDSRPPPDSPVVRQGTAWRLVTLALPVPSHERQHFRSRSPLAGGGRIGCRLTINGRRSSIPERSLQEFFGEGAGNAILKP